MTAVVEMFLPARTRFLVVPTVALIVWLLVARGSYRRVERIFLTLCSVYLVYVVAACVMHPPWGYVFEQTVFPLKELRSVKLDSGYLPMVIALVGTTIAPWMQFYVQSSVRDKGIKAEEYPLERIDVLTGAILSNAISFFIIVACAATLYGVLSVGDEFSATVAAQALEPVAGRWGKILFAVGLFNAAMVGAVVVPLSTAYAVTESLGWESGLGRRIREAPLFIGVYSGVIFLAALLILIPNQDLLDLIYKAQIINGALLPVVLVLMLVLINKKRLMGHYTNSRIYNFIAWVTVVVVALLSLAYFGLALTGHAPT